MATTTIVEIVAGIIAALGLLFVNRKKIGEKLAGVKAAPNTSEEIGLDPSKIQDFLSELKEDAERTLMVNFLFRLRHKVEDLPIETDKAEGLQAVNTLVRIFAIPTTDE